METGYIIALIILVVAVVLLIIAGVVAFTRAQPTISHLNTVEEDINEKINYYSKEFEVIQEKINKLQNRVQGTQLEATQKIERFNELQNHIDHLNVSLTHLKMHSNEYVAGATKITKEKITTEGPIIAKTFQRALGKTFRKQKERYSN